MLVAITQTTVSATIPAKPNIIFIMADDQGYGDASSYNPESKILTPGIDRIAKEGIRFTDAHSDSAVCTPTRYGLLTGRYFFSILPVLRGIETTEPTHPFVIHHSIEGRFALRKGKDAAGAKGKQKSK